MDTIKLKTVVDTIVSAAFVVKGNAKAVELAEESYSKYVELILPWIRKQSIIKDDTENKLPDADDSVGWKEFLVEANNNIRK